MTPTPDTVAAHVPRGALWRASFNGRRLPVFASLTVRGGHVCLHGTDEKSTREFFDELPGAAWVPVDGNGDRL